MKKEKVNLRNCKTKKGLIKIVELMERCTIRIRESLENWSVDKIREELDMAANQIKFLLS